MGLMLIINLRFAIPSLLQATEKQIAYDHHPCSFPSLLPAAEDKPQIATSTPSSQRQSADCKIATPAPSSRRQTTKFPLLLQADEERLKLPPLLQVAEDKDYRVPAPFRAHADRLLFVIPVLTIRRQTTNCHPYSKLSKTVCRLPFLLQMPKTDYIHSHSCSKLPKADYIYCHSCSKQPKTDYIHCHSCSKQPKTDYMHCHSCSKQQKIGLS